MAMTERQELEMLRAKKAAMNQPMQQAPLSERQELEMLRAKKAKKQQRTPQEVDDGLGDAALTMASGVGSTILGGLGAIGAGVNPYVQGADVVEQSQALIRQPKTEAGAEYLQQFSEFVEPFTTLMDTAANASGDFTHEKTNSPLAGTAAYMLPDAALTLATAGLGKGVTAASRGVAKIPQNISNKVIEGAQIRQGVRAGDTSSLTAGYKLANPTQVEKPFYVDTGNQVDNALQRIPDRPETLIEAIPHYSPFKSSVVTDDLARKALELDVPTDILNTMREATPETVNLSKKILTIRKEGYLNPSYAAENPSSIVVGDAFMKRIDALDTELAKSGKEIGKRLNVIGKEKADYTNAINVFEDHLAKNLITEVDGKLVFKGNESSVWAKSPENLKAMQDLYNDLGKLNNISDIHRLKTDIYGNVKYKTGGIKGDTSNEADDVLKSVAKELNQSIRDVDADYAKYNDKSSEIHTARKELIEAIPELKEGGKIKMSENIADVKADSEILGHKLRKLQTNYAANPLLQRTIKKHDDLARKYNYKFNDNINDLVALEASLTNRFGDPMLNSWQSGIQASIKRDRIESEKGGKGIPTSGKEGLSIAMERLRSKSKQIDDKEAFRTLRQYLESLNK